MNKVLFIVTWSGIFKTLLGLGAIPAGLVFIFCFWLTVMNVASVGTIQGGALDLWTGNYIPEWTYTWRHCLYNIANTLVPWFLSSLYLVFTVKKLRG